VNYSQHFSTRATPQSEQADPAQVQNSAGGYSFRLDKWKRLERWLILGAEGGSYYAGERQLTVENAKTIQECLDADGPRAVAIIAEVSDAGRAPKNDPAIFALAIAAGHKDPATRAAALAALPKVCRIGTHLFQFCEAVQNFRGWGRSLRSAVAAWYDAKDVGALAYQVAKYQQRNGWSHRDLLRLAHPAQTPEKAALYRWIVSREVLGERTVKRGGKVSEYAAVGGLPTYLAAFEELRAAKDVDTVCALIREHRFTHEMVASEWKAKVEVWRALSEHMPMTALIRNLAKLTECGVIAPLSSDAKRIAERLGNEEHIKKARVHPIAMLSALKVYAQGHGERGKLSWTPVPQITDALDAGFYLAFQNIEPTGKSTLLAIDVSGSMDTGLVAGIPGLTPRIGAAAMAMVTARTEPNWHTVGFASSGHGTGGRWGGSPPKLVDIAITPRQRLDDVIRAMQRIPMGGTDCALPMLWASQNRTSVDAFVILTDNETWHGSVHPHQALNAYRASCVSQAKLVVVGMTATEFSIAPPDDGGCLDVVGFDAAAPSVIADFMR
jgi:60 kDa SS-A/Ro ribonucleoprotein